jgi:hypothetical protein
MALNNAEKEQLETWAQTIERAGSTASNAHGRQLARVAEEMRAVAAGETTAAELGGDNPSGT